jgi:uncharacterized protein (UPF0548 family)
MVRGSLTLQRAPGFNYAEVGATRNAALPAGYRTLRVRTLVGRGRDAMRAATDAVMDWRLHRAIPVGIHASAPRAAPGVDVTVILGHLIRAPCRIVWTEETERRAGWAYGTLEGHPECGEESFVLQCDDEGDVWLTVTAFSRPAAWYTRAAGPLVASLQRSYARRCGRALSRLLR